MSRDVAVIFADIDAFDPTSSSLTSPGRDVPLRQRRPGHRARRRERSRRGLFSSIDGLTHHILKVYESGDTVIAKIDVEYLRKDGKSVTCRTPTSWSSTATW